MRYNPVSMIRIAPRRTQKPQVKRALMNKGYTQPLNTARCRKTIKNLEKSRLIEAHSKEFNRYLIVNYG